MSIELIITVLDEHQKNKILEILQEAEEELIIDFSFNIKLEERKS